MFKKRGHGDGDHEHDPTGDNGCLGWNGDGPGEGTEPAAEREAGILAAGIDAWGEVYANAVWRGGLLRNARVGHIQCVLNFGATGDHEPVSAQWRADFGAGRWTRRDLEHLAEHRRGAGVQGDDDHLRCAVRARGRRRDEHHSEERLAAFPWDAVRLLAKFDV